MLSVSAVLLTAGIAAGTPLPDPPFSSGGFVPPDSLTFKQETAVSKIISKYSVNRTKCDQKALIALQLAYEPANMGKVPDVQGSWQACVAKVSAAFDKARDALVLKGTPACLDAAGIDAIRAQIDALLPGLSGIVFCDGDAAAPDPVTMLNIPDFKNEASGEVAAAKVLTKAGVLAGKCYSLAAKTAFQTGGTIPPEILDKFNACLQKYSDGGSAAIDKLDQTQKLPACLPVATAQALLSTTISLAGQFSDETYCAE